MGNKNFNNVDILIVGAGMYACGKGTDGFGTILPAVLQAYKLGLVNKISIAATSRNSAISASEKAKQLSNLLEIKPDIKFFPEEIDNDDKAYIKALKHITNPCCAIVSVPDNLHFEITKTLIENKIHVLVVKPLVPKVQQVKELISLANNSNVYGAVEYHKRYDEANLKLLELIKQGILGDLIYFRINYSQRKIIPTSIFRNWVDTTDVFQYLGVHYVDLIHFLTQAMPVRVMSYGSKKWLIQKGIDNFDTIQTQIEWKLPETGGAFLSSHFTSWIDPNTSTAMSDQRIEVIGTKGRYHSDQKNRGVFLVTDADGVEEINPYFTQIYTSVDGISKEVKGYGPKSIIQFLKDVVDLTKGSKNISDMKGLRPTFESSLYPTAVLEASQISLDNGNNWVSIDNIQKAVSL